MVLEDRSQGIGRITLPLKVLGKIFHCLYQLFVGPWPHHSNLCLCLQVAFSPCLFMSFSLDLGPTLNQHEFTLHGCVLSGFCFVRLFGTLWTVFREATQSMGFSRQEYWSRLLCPPPGDLPNPGIEPTSPVLKAMLAVISAYVSTLCQIEYETEVQSLTLCTWPHGWVRSRIVIRPRATVQKSYSFHCIMLFLHWESW